MPPERAHVAKLVSDLVAIDSVNPSLVPGAAGEANIAHFVASWLAGEGVDAWEVEVAPDRPNVVGRVAGARGGRTLMLNAHVDTVGTAGMESPFTPRVEGNRLYGRGAYDMKGSLASIMLAASLVRRTPDFCGELLVTAVVDEEYASLGTESVVATLPTDAAIVTEPTGLRICTAHKGFAWIAVETEGRAAHGSRPALGIDAIAHMGRVLVDLEESSRALSTGSSHPLLGAGSLHASLIEGGQELSSYPERCRLKVERRTVPGETAESVMAGIDGLLRRRAAEDPAFKAKAELLFWREPFEVPPDAEIVETLSRNAASLLGVVPEIYGDTPWMDSALLSAAGIPTVVFGPGGAGAHAAIEYSLLDEVATGAEILASTAIDFCRSTGGTGTDPVMQNS